MNEMRGDPCEHPVNVFLGAEFLAWLWWRSAQGQGEVEIPKLGPVAFWVDEELELKGKGEDDSKARWTGAVPVSGPEALAGLAVGKRVSRLRFALRVQGREAEVSIDAETLDLVSVRNPKLDSRGSIERMEERVQYLELIRSVVDALFLGFLQARLHSRWGTEWAPEMRTWIAQSRPTAPTQ